MSRLRDYQDLLNHTVGLICIGLLSRIVVIEMNLAVKTITIEPAVVLQWLKGERLSLPAARVSDDAKLIKAGYNAQRNEFWVEVRAESFDDRGSEKRMPQEFHAEIEI